MCTIHCIVFCLVRILMCWLLSLFLFTTLLWNSVQLFFCLLLLWWAGCLLLVWFTLFVLRSGRGNDTLRADTVVAVSINVHIICNSLITGVIRDVMFTSMAYISPITTIVSNRHIFKKFTNAVMVAAIAVAVCVARSFSDGGIFQTETSIHTLTWSVMNERILHRFASLITLTRIIINGTIWYISAWMVTVTRAITDFDVVCFKTRIFLLCKREEMARRRRHFWDDNTDNLHSNNNNTK